MQSIKVVSPASVANLACGFDVIGLALHKPFDIIEISQSDVPGISIRHLDNYNLPEDPQLNVAGVALQSMLTAVPDVKGFDITIKKGIMPGSGLGSSAASAAGVVIGANYLLNNRFPKQKLLEFAMYGEQLASNARHADNIAPLIYGGLNLIRSLNPIDITQVKCPPLYIVVLHPLIEIKTSDSRKKLPQKIPLKIATKQWADLAGLITGCMGYDYDLISRSLNDHIIEQYRSSSIPHFHLVKKRCLEAGALGGSISGSGPSVFMLCKDEVTAMQVEAAMTEVYVNSGIYFRTYVSTINWEGVKLLPGNAEYKPLKHVYNEVL